MVPSSCEVEVDRNSEPLLTLAFFMFQVAQGASDVGLAWIYKEKFQ